MTRFAKALPLLLLLAVCVVAQTHTTVRHHKEVVENQPPEIAQAEEAIQKNDFTSAETLLKKALDSDPAGEQAWCYQAWFDLGFVLNHVGRSGDSIAAYRKAVVAKPDVFESNLNLGLMLARTRDPEAEKFLRAATTLKPTAHVEEGQARAWLSLAHLIENRDPAQALEAYKHAADLTPNDPEPHISAGLLDERQKDFPAAEAEYKKVLGLEPQSTEAAIGLTNIYMKSGHVDQAEPLLRRLTAERPEDAGLHLQLARVLATQGKKDDAVTELQTVVKFSPKDAEAQRELADLLVQDKKLPDAEKIYRDLIADHPNDADLHGQLGEVLLKEHKFPDAQIEFIATIKLKPDLGEAYGSLAVAANETNNYPLTIKALDARAKLLPETPVSYFLRATALDHLQDYKQASKYYHLFLDLAAGKYPDEEWKARHRLVAIEPKKR
jgi:tetratricopeptide (TPR) repeat protein